MEECSDTATQTNLGYSSGELEKTALADGLRVKSERNERLKTYTVFDASTSDISSLTRGKTDLGAIKTPFCNDDDISECKGPVHHWILKEKLRGLVRCKRDINLGY